MNARIELDSGTLIAALYHLQGSGTLDQLAQECGRAMAQELHRLQKEDAIAAVAPPPQKAPPSKAVPEPPSGREG